MNLDKTRMTAGGMKPRLLGRFICAADSFVGTWLDPGMWWTRLKLMASPDTATTLIRYVGHRLNTDEPIFRIEEDREHEWMECVRCGEEVYMGWRPWHGEPGPTLDEVEADLRSKGEWTA